MKNWIEQIDRTTQCFIDEFGDLNFKELNWKPNPETWSIAQNIDHLIVINNSYFPVIAAIQKGTYKTPLVAKIGLIVSAFGNSVLKSVHPDRKKKMKTFTIWEPEKIEFQIEILDRFIAHQSELKEIIIDSKNLLAKGIVISSPANKFIVYKLEKAFDIIVLHEQRHFEQAKALYKLIKEQQSL